MELSNLLKFDLKVPHALKRLSVVLQVVYVSLFRLGECAAKRYQELSEQFES